MNSPASRVSIQHGPLGVDVDLERAALRVQQAGQLLLDVPLRVAVSPFGGDERDLSLRLASDHVTEQGLRQLVIDVESSHLPVKRYLLELDGDRLSLRVRARARFAIDKVCYFKGDGGRTGARRFYAPRFDWSEGAVLRPIGQDELLACQQWLSPPPFAYMFEHADGWRAIGVAAGPGEHNYQSLALCTSSGLQFTLDYEEHWSPDAEFETPALVVHLQPQPEPNAALKVYVHAMEHLLPQPAEQATPAWWAQPLFCSWGEQRLQYRLRHDNGENGWWVNAGDYANEQLLTASLKTLEQHGVHPGTVIVDCFWSLRGSFCQPDPLLWSDLKGFIAGQHKLGRKVLLWLTPILFDGLPREACITLAGAPVAADPTSDRFRRLFADEITKMISPQGLDADGFKIDFTQNIPSESGLFRNFLKDKWAIISERPEKNHIVAAQRHARLQTAKPRWGVELIRAYLEAIRAPMKAAKADALLITHTPHPALRDLPDMIRLNDLDGTLSRDVPGIMRNRAAITRACGGDHWLIDTDNDLMIDKAMWRAYIADQPHIGVPDTYYATGIATSGELFDADDYRLLSDTWAAYRKAKGL